MAADDVKTEILAPMQRLYMPTKQISESETDKIAALQQYVSALEGFGKDALHAAWAEVRDKWVKLSWPPPAMFVQAARRAARVGKTSLQTRNEERNAEKQKRWARWLEVRTSELGLGAARDGFAYGLKMAILEEGKTADQISVAEHLAESAQARRTLENLQPCVITDILLRMAAQRNEFEKETSYEIEMANAKRQEFRQAPQQIPFHDSELLP